MQEQPGTKRLYRSMTDRKIAGVCGGIAAHFDIDPVIVRLGWVLATFIIPPLTTLGYVASWLIIPEEPRPAQAAAGEAPAHTAAASGSATATGAAPVVGPSILQTDGHLLGGALFIGIGLFFLLLNLDILDTEWLRFWRWRAAWPLVLIVLGIFLLVRAVRPWRGAGAGGR